LSQGSVFLTASDFVVARPDNEFSVFLGKQKGQKSAKRTKKNLFAVFAHFCPFCFPK
jgi:hypothetical protein